MVVNQFGANIHGPRAGLREIFSKPRLHVNNAFPLDAPLFWHKKSPGRSPSFLLLKELALLDHQALNASGALLIHHHVVESGTQAFE